MHRGYADTFYIDEVFVNVNGKKHYLWRVVDQKSLTHERSECFGFCSVLNRYYPLLAQGVALMVLPT